MWLLAVQLAKKIELLSRDTDISFKDAQVPPQRQPSRRLQALVGEVIGGASAAASPEEYHKVNTYFRSLDKVIGELKCRFDSNEQDLLRALGEIALEPSPSPESFDLVATHYGLQKDLLKIDHSVFQNFLDNLEKNKDLEQYQPKTATTLYQTFCHYNLLDMLPEFSKLVTIFTVIPATSCSAERSFSGLRRLKNYLRSTMGQTRLSNLVVLNIERSYANQVLEYDMDKMIDMFTANKKRHCYFF